ncbi:MAG: hypothetical protein A2042_09965 [Candidatus Schekmanbacteria bacterium GWA2_38_11]|uniref:Periplasmic chaperone PpiD n=1 Tax=Candidatus Schekmanbacteria bacterium GWA2_38_11 TaxID=1817876 RepID=A0A1F7RF50_9BACT|nr:MAG: hypothetical protein A2042_09965 [Candidatus Schekmanbacteria bacterium GWA2_38_11]
MKTTKQFFLAYGIISLIFLFVAMPGYASDEKVAKSDEKVKENGWDNGEEQIALNVPISSPSFSIFPIAIVNDEPITIEDLKKAVGRLHGGVEKKETSSRKDYSEIIKRLINTKLIVQEAKNMGFDELEEVKNMVDKYAKSTLLSLLQGQYVKDLKADEAEVDKLYKQMVKEWKIKSVLFDKEDDAKKFEEEIKAGGNFDERIESLITEGKVKGKKEGVYLKDKDLLPQIIKTLSDMNAGSISPVISVDSGYIVFRLDDVRYPDNPDVKDEARDKVLEIERFKALSNYNRELSNKYIKLNKKIIDTINFESKQPGFQNLLKDKRVVAEVKGGKPVTVEEWAEAIKKEFFHGVDEAIKNKKINQKKIDILQKILGKKIFRLEALKKGIDKTEEYKSMINEYEISVLFGLFMRKVIAPNVKLKDEELKAYYDEHISEFSFPQMMKIDTIVFKKIQDAESSLDKLKKGAEFSFIKENADGQVDGSTEGLLGFGNAPVVTSELSEDVQRAVAGAGSGDLRMYVSPEKYYYILYIKDMIPSKPQPFEDAKDLIYDKVLKNKLGKAVDDWTDKLRKDSTIRIYAIDYNNK